MAGDGKISVTYVVNSSQYNKNIADMKKNMQLLNQEVKTSAQEINTYGENIQSLTKQQSSINQALSQSKKILAEYESSLSKNNTSLEKNQKKLGELARQKEEANKAYKEAVKTYGEESEEALKSKEALEEVNKAYQKQEKIISSNQNAIRSNLTQIEKTKQEQLKLEQQLEQTNKAIEEQGNKFIKASEKFVTAGQALESAGGSIKDCGEEAQKAGALILTASAGLATMSASFETGLAKVNTLVNDSNEGIKTYKESVMDLSNNTGVAVTDLTDALYDAISAGVEYSESTKFIEDVNKVAVGGFTDIASASNLLTQVMNIYGKSVDEVGDVSNKLFLVQKNGVTTVGQLASSMGEAMTMGASYNVNLENILSSYASLTKQGRTASTAQTQLKTMIQELGDTGTEVGKILKEKTSKSFTQLMKEGYSLYDALKIIKDSCKGNEDAFNNLWSSTEAGLSAMSLLSKDGEYFNSTLNEMANSAGLTDEAFNTMANTSEYKFKKAINETKNSLIKLGESLLPLMDEVSEGISKVADFISKLNPEIVTSIAKFGALSLVFGTVMKATGSLVTVLGKGVSGIGGLLKIASDTKSLGSFTKALAQSEGAVGGLAKTLGGLTLKGGVIGLAVAGIGALGLALYNNHKEIKESEKAYSELDGKIGEFTGRLRSNENIWTQIFGKEYSWKFSEEYKTALNNAEGDVANWVETLKGYQDQIYEILNSTEIGQQTKDEQVATLIKDTIGAGNIDSQIAALTAGMNEKGFSQEQINKTVEDFKNAMSGIYSEIEGLELKGLEMIKKYTTNTVDEMGNQVTNIDWDGFNKEFSEYLNENHNFIVSTQQTNYDDLLEITQKYNDEQKIIYGEAIEGSLEYNKKTVDNIKNSKLEEIQALRDSAKEHGQYTDEYKQMLNERERAVELYANTQKVSLQRMALYDADFAEQNNLTTKQLNENAYMIIDNVSGISTAYFDSEEALKRYADATMSNTAIITDEIGNMHTVIVDDFGNITGIVDEGAETFGVFSNSAIEACNKVIEQAGVTAGTAEDKFNAICTAIDDGTLSAEQFGMTKEEFKAAAKEMINAEGDANALKNKLNEIPKNVSSKVEVSGLDEANSKAEGLLTKLGKIASKTWNAIFGTSEPKKKESGGSIETAGIYNINERGLELVDTLGKARAYTLGDAVQGEYAYLPKNSRVTNAVMTTKKMNDMIDSKLNNTIGVYLKEMNKIFSNSNNCSGVNIHIDEAHFENKENEQRSVNNIKRILGSIK